MTTINGVHSFLVREYYVTLVLDGRSVTVSARSTSADNALAVALVKARQEYNLNRALIVTSTDLVVYCK